ncbi:sensor histidine kinase [Bacillus dakarensis]|uniref:sensor histidine kinase n=1 Tax=Robertmurraya dakarensis TaxID=1926278 RepID=UPI000981DCA9|nr:sensor histidine kinase [Bacillus dakarensis]
MIKAYFLEKLSWILMFFFIHILILFVAFIDAAIPFMPILYIVFLSWIFFTIFFFLRYHKEIKFYKHLKEWDSDLDLTRIPTSDSPFQKIIVESLTSNTSYLKQLALDDRRILEQEKDELLAWIHEVKTPLTAMHLMIDRLEEEKTKELIRYEWMRIHLLLDQQLHQRRIPFLENDLYIEQTNLKDIIYQEIKMLRPWCMQKGIGFDINLQIANVLSDAKWLAFILRQLITNAVKYSENSDIEVNSFTVKDQDVLEIKDFGRGIDSKDLPRIFEKGFTSTANHQDHNATGMGLYLTKKVTAPLLIKIDVQSEVGMGTLFTLMFPKKNDFDHISSV